MNYQLCKIIALDKNYWYTKYKHLINKVIFVDIENIQNRKTNFGYLTFAKYNNEEICLIGKFEIPCFK